MILVPVLLHLIGLFGLPHGQSRERFFPEKRHSQDNMHPAGEQAFHTFKLSGHAQGTTWQITYFNPDSSVSTSQIDSILIKLDSSLSLYKPYSLIRQFNASPRQLKIDDHFVRVVNMSLETWRQTNGLFDITVQPLVEAWGFSAGKDHPFPDSSQIQSLLSCIGSQELSLEGHYLVKKKPCIKIDLDGIAQGYSVDVLADFLEAHFITNYLVELGGEIRVRGKKLPSGEKLKIGIETPPSSEFEPTAIQKILAPGRGAITTSGSYRAFREHGGKSYSHIIDPRTGFPYDGELISVTVYAQNAITADAYDNSLLLMGLRGALRFVENRKDLAAYFIYRKKDGTIGDTASTRFASLIEAARND